MVFVLEDLNIESRSKRSDESATRKKAERKQREKEERGEKAQRSSRSDCTGEIWFWLSVSVNDSMTCAETFRTSIRPWGFIREKTLQFCWEGKKFGIIFPTPRKTDEDYLSLNNFLSMLRHCVFGFTIHVYEKRNECSWLIDWLSKRNVAKGNI